MKMSSSLTLTAILISFCLFSENAHAQRRGRRNQVPTAQRQQNTNPRIHTSADGAGGATKIVYDMTLAAASNQQALYVGAATDSTSPESIGLSIMSVSRNYRYAGGLSLKILADGMTVVSLRGDYLFRRATVDERGNAVEVVSTVMTLAQLRSIANARRVDVELWIDRFTLSPTNIYDLREYASRLESLAVNRTDDDQSQPETTVIQPPPACAVAVEQSPALRGFRLRMPVAEVQRRFPGINYINIYQSKGIPTIKIKPLRRGDYMLDGLAVRNYSDVTDVDLTSFPDLEGVQMVELAFQSDSVAKIVVSYENKSLWADTDSFIQAVGPLLNLPTSGWARGSGFSYSGETKALTCGDWKAEAVASRYTAALLIEDLAAARRREEEKREKEEQQRREIEEKRKVFKP